MRALYSAATGMAAQQLKIDNISNNLANVSTTGYKKARESFEDLVYQNLPIGGVSNDTPRPVGIQIGTGVRTLAITRDFRNGDQVYTGNQFDVTIGGRGFFVLEGPNGEERYTRDGHFIKNADGELVTAAGYKMSPGIEVPEDAIAVIISEDGTVQAQYQDQVDLATLGVIQLVDFVNPAGLRAVGGNLFTVSPESGEPQILEPGDGFVNLQQGFLENSNVDIAEELINMIIAQRAFETNSKVIETEDQNLQTVNQLKR